MCGDQTAKDELHVVPTAGYSWLQLATAGVRRLRHTYCYAVRHSSARRRRPCSPGSYYSGDCY